MIRNDNAPLPHPERETVREYIVTVYKPERGPVTYRRREVIHHDDTGADWAEVIEETEVTQE